MYITKLRIEEDTVAQPRVDERAESRRSESEKRTEKTDMNLTWDLQGEILGLNKKTYDLNRDQGKKIRALHLDSERNGMHEAVTPIHMRRSEISVLASVPPS